VRTRQRGLSLLAVLVGGAVLILGAVLAMKILPAYFEFYNAKKLIIQIANERHNNPVDVRKSFDLKAGINDVHSIQSKDLDITKEGGVLVIAFAYRKEVPLFGNLGVYMDFAASAGPGAARD